MAIRSPDLRNLFQAFQGLGQSNALLAQRRRQAKAQRDARRQALLTLGASAAGAAVLGPAGASFGAGAASLLGPQPDIGTAAQFGFQGFQMGEQADAREAAAAKDAQDTAARQEAALLLRGTSGQEFFDPDTGGLTEEIGGTPSDPAGAAAALLKSPRLAGAGFQGAITLAGQEATAERGATTAVAKLEQFNRAEAGRNKRAAARLAGDGVKPFRDTAYVNMTPRAKKPLWEPQAITTQAQADALIKKHGSENVTFDVPKGTGRTRAPNNYLLRNGQTVLSHDDRTYLDPTGESRDIPSTAIRLGPDVAAKEARGARQRLAAGAPSPAVSAPTIGGRSLISAVEGGGVGPLSNIEAAIDAVAGGLGLQQAFGKTGSMFPKTQQNRQYLKAVRQLGKAAFVNNPRFPVAEQKLVDGLLPDPNKFWVNPATAAEDIVTLRFVLNGMKASNNNAISGGLLSPAKQDDLVMKNADIDRMLSFMGGTPSQPQAQPVPRTQPTPNKELTALFAVDTTGWDAVRLRKHKLKIQTLMRKDKEANPELF